MNTAKLGHAAIAAFLILAALPLHSEMTATAVGHEYRQDDWPSIAAAPDGSLWVAWLSFAGDRDDVAIRHYVNGKWSTLHWVPGTSGDSWLPQVAVDSANRVWVVWSQQLEGNWDIFARRFDPQKQEWAALERLSSDKLPDINPRLTSNGKGQLALVWQGFRDKNSNIFLKTLDGEKWSNDIRVTNRAANDWEPAAAIDGHGTVWVAYDSYKSGNYDVMVSEVRNGQVEPEMAVAATANFEARATVAVDTSNRVWVAWESGGPNSGKDAGFVIAKTQPGVFLGAARDAEIKCYDGGQWRTPAAPLSPVFHDGRTYQPHVYSDGRGSVWVAAKVMESAKSPILPATQVYFEYQVTHFLGDKWAPPVVLPNSKGRSSTRLNATLGPAGELWLAWPTENRPEKNLHRPMRAQVYVGSLPAAAAAQAKWKPEPDAAVVAKPGHSDEAGDLRAIRGYTASVGGKAHHIVRGDFHRHTEFSWDSGGFNDGSLQDFYRYMIDCAGMDFGASTDHQGGGWAYWWWISQKMSDMYHVPGAYVPIFGYERSAIWPNGHRNVFFAKRSESRVTPFFLMEGAPGQGFGGFGLPVSPHGDEPAVGTADLVGNDTKLMWEDIRPRNGISIPHTSATRMGTDWRDNDPQMEPVVEIFQGIRTSQEQDGAPYTASLDEFKSMKEKAGYHAEGFVSNAWGKGYKLGVIASSDHYSTHISYALVYTDDPTRQGILDAIRKRHTYAAMDNIIVDVRMGEHFMGDEFSLKGAAPLRVKLLGPDAIASVVVIRDSAVIYTVQPNSRKVEFDFKDTNAPAGRHYYYIRAQQQNKMLAWSSPMFVTYTGGK